MAKKAGVKKAATASAAKKKTTASVSETKKTKLKTDAAKAAVGANAKATTKRKTASNTRAAGAVAGAPAPPARKRKTSADEEVEKAAAEPKPKKARVAKAPVTRKLKPKVVINKAPTQKLRVFVCGEGSQGELGLGAAKGTVDVKRPRLNALLAPEDVGVVQVAAGGMHCVALTHDGRVLTWGVNDQGALGRDTTWEGGLKDIDDAKSDDSSDSGSDSGLNPYESTPTAIPSDAFPEGTVIVQVAAGDSSSFALTDDGLVYGWGTFRVRVFAFSYFPKRITLLTRWSRETKESLALMLTRRFRQPQSSSQALRRLLMLLAATTTPSLSTIVAPFLHGDPVSRISLAAASLNATNSTDYSLANLASQKTSFTLAVAHSTRSQFINLEKFTAGA